MSEVIHVKTETDEFCLKGRTCEVSSYSFIPKERKNPPERTYFGSEKKGRYSNSTYDRLFKQDEGYNNKLHRDDREHAKLRGLTVNDEEKEKIVPTLSSSEYGHRLKIHVDHPDRAHVRIGYVNSEFYRRNGITS
ncbi:uncharacterized protein C5orf49 homolog [Haliotis rufescens]|uniref:uncharacterized protein C5orf49 homolog n=1 Tax=Haliotis rufescens TaxID=6454 RepID=UPI001EAF9C39|nr:uncharacterized protein C5orf49 homolog [Haliotis rufescens]